jgi:hypothetical protein
MPRAPPKERAPLPPKYKSKDFPALAPPDPPSDGTATTYSAARRVYEMAECRVAIGRWLKGKELKAMMRVTRRGMFDVAKELYKEVRFDFVQNKMFIGTVSQKCRSLHTILLIYRNASELIARQSLQSPRPSAISQSR